jgi:hypothetical protein
VKAPRQKIFGEKMKAESIQPLTYRDAEMYGEAPLNENRAKREEYVDAQYVGNRKDLKGSKGDSYFDASADIWMYRPKGQTEWFRVMWDSLRFIPKRVKKKTPR